MNDKPVYILQDTGANISIMNKEYVNNGFLNVINKNLNDILSDVDNLQVRWYNNEILPYEDYVKLEVSQGNNTTSNGIIESFLITPEKFHCPILGRNANKQISQNYQPK